MERPPANWPSRFWPWSSQEDTDRTFPTAILAEPFPGAAPPFGSKDEDEDDEPESDETGESVASQLCWGTFALDALDDTMVDDPKENDAAIDYSKDGEARDTSVSFTLSSRDTVVTSDGRTVSLKWLAANSDECLVGNCIGFMTNVLRSTIAGQEGITSPLSKLPSAPPGAAEKAKKKERAGRGVEGHGDEAIDPMSTMDKFNWDHLPLPGLGQI